MPDTLTTSTLESLRESVRNATGADRDLDLDILKGLDKAPADAVWETPYDELFGGLFPKKEWERPGYRSAMDDHRAFVSRTIRTSSDPDAAAKMIDEHEPQWDFKNDPQFGSVPNFTSSIDACVRLIEQVLPGWWWKCGTCCVSDDACIAPDFNSPIHGERLKAEIGPIEPGSPYDEGFDIDRRPPENVPLALLEALLTALIEIEKIRQPT